MAQRMGLAQWRRLRNVSIHRQQSGPSRVDTAMVRNGDHMYTGEEAQVAQIIADWTDRAVRPPRGSGPVSDER
jgi:hypothetical protein